MKRVFLSILIFLITFSAFSQESLPIEVQLNSPLNMLSENITPELAYIQTSKDIYENLEDLWFKVYLLDAQHFTPSGLSQTLYMQMLNEKTMHAVWQEKYEIQNGFANGHIFVADSLPEGDYLLAAYTQNSFFNDSSDMKAYRRIHITKEVKVNYAGTENSENAISHSKTKGFQFGTYPESGNLVSGIRSQLAFKAVNKDGTPLDVQGVLYEDSLPLVQFKSTHAGMGSLSFTPKSEKKYHVRILQPKTDSIFLLPAIYPEGITLRLANRNDSLLEFVVSQSPHHNTKKVYLRGQIRGVVYCMATGLLKKNLIIKIPLREFTCQGIAEFTLFNDSLIPVAERLVYINPNKKLNIQTQLSKEKYETREKATLKITVKDENGQPVTTNLGVSVFDKLYQIPGNPENVLAHCYLTSQLKGKIYDPVFYFDPKQKDVPTSLDLLMLTQGWRRYVWSEPAMEHRTKLNVPVIYDGIPGEVHSTARPKKAKKSILQTLMISYPEKNKTQELIFADSSGKFTITPQHLKSGQGDYVYIKPMASEEFKAVANLSDPFQTINELRKTKDINYPQVGVVEAKDLNLADTYVEGHNTIRIAEVTVKAKSQVRLRGKFIGHLDSLAKIKYAGSDYVCLKHKPPILNCWFPLCKKDPKRRAPIDGETVGVIYDLNTQPTDQNYIPNNIDNFYYCCIREKEYHNPNQRFTPEELLKMNNLTLVKGYYPQREFYQPKYDKETEDLTSTDYRNTLFWGPLVITNEKGEATVEFFCSDINSRFTGKIEGVNGSGLLGSTDFEFSVLKKN